MWTISGGPLTGYHLQDSSGNDVRGWTKENMWDAIQLRDKLNRGEVK